MQSGQRRKLTIGNEAVLLEPLLQIILVNALLLKAANEDCVRVAELSKGKEEKSIV
jgi:hypothetical protein